MASSSGAKLSREEFKRAKELEELRKAGAAPPEVDEEGKMVNPHMPHYIAQRPWYAEDLAVAAAGARGAPGLKHQYGKHFGRDAGAAAEEEAAEITKPRARVRRGPAAKRFRKGACTNCGAAGHKAADCVERRRRRGAAWTGRDICGDDLGGGQAAARSFAAKRDRYDGYDPAEYRRVVERHERAEAARRKAKEAEIDAAARAKAERRRERRAQRKIKKLGVDGGSGGGGGEGDGAADSDAEAADSDAEDSDDSDDEGVRGVEGSIHERNADTRTSVRNLRQREDRAKYLLNLDPDSAYYDPKTRSMRQNPLPHMDPSEVPFAGDNFVRGTGLEKDARAMEAFVWEANSRGNEEVNAVANPSAAERMHAQFVERRERLKSEKRRSVLEKYGGEEHLNAPSRELRMAQTEAYTEYAPDGSVLAGHEPAVPSTKYAEDVLEQNHTAVWGSYYRDGRWGYACCRATVRNAYCTGGSASASASATAPATASAASASSSAAAAAAAAAAEPVAAAPLAGAGALSGVVVTDDGEPAAKRRRREPATLDEAIQEAERRRMAGPGGATSAAMPAAPSAAAAEADMERYQRERQHADDPLAGMKKAGAELIEQ